MILPCCWAEDPIDGLPSGRAPASLGKGLRFLCPESSPVPAFAWHRPGVHFHPSGCYLVISITHQAQQSLREKQLWGSSLIFPSPLWDGPHVGGRGEVRGTKEEESRANLP